MPFTSYAILLQTASVTAAPASDLQGWGPGVLAVASLALTVYLNMRKENREDGLTMAQRVKRSEVSLQEVGLRQTGLQLEVERVADAARQAREAIREEHRRDFEGMRDQVKELPALRDLVVRMVEKADNTSKSFDKLDTKVDSIINMLRKP